MKETPTPNTEHLIENLQEFAKKSQSILMQMLEKQFQISAIQNKADPLAISTAFLEGAKQLSHSPEIIVNAQLGYWQDMLALWHEIYNKSQRIEASESIKIPDDDKRFKSQKWTENLIFDFFRKSYLITSKWTFHLVENIQDIDPKTRHKIKFHTTQWLNALSPSNFIFTNPDILHAILESNGRNLIDGLQNLMNDIDFSTGKLSISMVDKEAFQVGKNLATTPGKVIFQNQIMQLIQYEPRTKKAYKKPLLFIPPWINKFYILDLQPQNSLVQWVLEQGYTIFMISWVNPDEAHRHIGFEDYMEMGILEAVSAIQKQIGTVPIQAVSYCIGGTLLAATLAYMKQHQDERICSATFLTSMIDFKDAGDLGAFIDETQLTYIDQLMEEKGYLDPQNMMDTFNTLRSNDLIWSFVIHNYLLGQKPPAFDLLYWNCDATGMPEKMHQFYLKEMYLKNNLSKPNGIEIKGAKIDLSHIDIPCFILSTEDDHIAPWKSTYLATQIYKSDVTFCLAGSGHIAGVINPPHAEKYYYYENSKTPSNPDEWLENSIKITGSWWPKWLEWQRQFSGPKVNTKTCDKLPLKIVEDAPGSYVLK